MPHRGSMVRLAAIAAAVILLPLAMPRSGLAQATSWSGSSKRAKPASRQTASTSSHAPTVHPTKSSNADARDSGGNPGGDPPRVKKKNSSTRLVPSLELTPVPSESSQPTTSGRLSTKHSAPKTQKRAATKHST